MNERASRLLVFAKAPIPGQAKTRLIPALGEARAATLHQALVEHTLDRATKLQYPVELWCSPSTAHPFFAHCRGRYGVALRSQRGPDLGARMAYALQQALAMSEGAVLIGTDCPAMETKDLHDAFQALDQENEAVLGPVDDGGYWLLGLRRFSPDLFAEIPWGGTDVLKETLRRIDRLRWRYALLASRWDLDRPEDLDRLESLNAPPGLPPLQETKIRNGRPLTAADRSPRPQ